MRLWLVKLSVVAASDFKRSSRFFSAAITCIITEVIYEANMISYGSSPWVYNAEGFQIW
jgi:hypothetical protein